jgi:hypothetical protein
MCQIITSFISPIAGGLVVGGIGIWMSGVNRRRDGKDAFLLVTADLKGKLAGTNKGRLDEFYQQSIPVVGPAVYRVLQFLNKDQQRALDAVWNEYRSQGEKLFGHGEEMLTAVVESMLEGSPQTPWKRLADFFDKFDNCVHSRKPKI